MGEKQNSASKELVISASYFLFYIYSVGEMLMILCTVHTFCESILNASFAFAN